MEEFSTNNTSSSGRRTRLLALGASVTFCMLAGFAGWRYAEKPKARPSGGAPVAVEERTSKPSDDAATLTEGRWDIASLGIASPENTATIVRVGFSDEYLAVATDGFASWARRGKGGAFGWNRLGSKISSRFVAYAVADSLVVFDADTEEGVRASVFDGKGKRRSRVTVEDSTSMTLPSVAGVSGSKLTVIASRTNSNWSVFDMQSGDFDIWNPMGGSLTSAMFCDGMTRSICVGRGSDGALWGKLFDGAKFGEWFSLGGTAGEEMFVKFDSATGASLITSRIGEFRQSVWYRTPIGAVTTVALTMASKKPALASLDVAGGRAMLWFAGNKVLHATGIRVPNLHYSAPKKLGSAREAISASGSKTEDSVVFLDMNDKVQRQTFVASEPRNPASTGN